MTISRYQEITALGGLRYEGLNDMVSSLERPVDVEWPYDCCRKPVLAIEGSRIELGSKLACRVRPPRSVCVYDGGLLFYRVACILPVHLTATDDNNLRMKLAAARTASTPSSLITFALRV